MAGVVPHVRLWHRAAFVVKKHRPVVDAEVTEVLGRWRPQRFEDSDLRALGPLKPRVREWVTAATPPNANRTRLLLRATSQITIWAKRALGTVDVRVVLHPDNIEHFVMVVNAHQSASWRGNARGALRTVGAGANPQWPATPRHVKRRVVVPPYT